ncbi:unnamed protein product, partial [Anisakis simplex]|uniref:Uncharacterized protein n=1 Tax=Anisakis simplex TaxID=6269 RepID=A0A0M3JLI0_ANISI
MISPPQCVTNRSSRAIGRRSRESAECAETDAAQLTNNVNVRDAKRVGVVTRRSRASGGVGETRPNDRNSNATSETCCNAKAEAGVEPKRASD